MVKTQNMNHRLIGTHQKMHIVNRPRCDIHIDPYKSRIIFDSFNHNSVQQNRSSQSIEENQLNLPDFDQEIPKKAK